MLKPIYDLMCRLEAEIDHDCKITLTKERSMLCVRVDVWVKAEKYSCAKLFPVEALDINTKNIAMLFNSELNRAIKI